MPHRFWTPVEDWALLDGASKEDVRNHFRNWINTRSVERDGPGADTPNIADRVPRYRSYLYIDKEVLQSVSIYEFPDPNHPQGFSVSTSGRVVVIDGQHGDYRPDQLGFIGDGSGGEQEEEREEYEPIEGNTELDLGWMYASIDTTEDLYDLMCEDPDTWVRPYFYKRPPAVWTGDLW